MTMYRKLFTVSLILPASLLLASCAQDSSSEDLSDDLPLPDVSDIVQAEAQAPGIAALSEAPAGFDNESNGFPLQFAATLDEAKDTFSEVELFEDGVGPVFNNTSCVSCHESPFQVAGTGSQITELRAGHFNGTTFSEHPGGSLINDRANDRSIQEHVLAGNEVRTQRITLSIMGDAYVEAIDSNMLAAVAAGQPAGQRGTFIQVAVAESGGALRGGRFGWKNQNASLTSFSGDAYVNEMGVTNRLFPTENSSNGTNVQGGPFDGKGDPTQTGEDDAGDVDVFADFMRSLKAPPRGPITAAVTRGQTQFNNAGCAVCHRATYNTVPAGTVINQGALTVSAAIGDKIIHPFGDYLLHDIGTGDGIVQNGGQGTRNMVRTAPLWGIGVRDRLMHEGNVYTVQDAIQRHGNQGAASRTAFNRLSAAAQNDLVAFVLSL
jgi:CxxC motif-containing protein (DUF1111 family)